MIFIIVCISCCNKKGYDTIDARCKHKGCTVFVSEEYREQNVFESGIWILEDIS